MVIVAAVVIPMVWLVLAAAIGGRDAVDLNRPGTDELPRLTTTMP